jgi:hypothetical protein
MRKFLVITVFLATVLSVRAAMAGVATSLPVVFALAFLLVIASALFMVVLPAVLLSFALRTFFNYRDAELDEPSIETLPVMTASSRTANSQI